MATDKKSFLLYCDLIHTVNELPDDKAGELFKHILSYVNDENPVTDDLLIRISFEPIKQQLKRDLKKYESIVDRNRNNGLKGGRPKKPKEPTGLIGNPTEPKKADSDTDTVIDIVNDKEIRELTFREQVAKHSYSDKLKSDFCDYWTESKPKGKKLRFEMQQTFDISRRLKKWESNNFGKKTDTGVKLTERLKDEDYL